MLSDSVCENILLKWMTKPSKETEKHIKWKSGKH